MNKNKLKSLKAQMEVAVIAIGREKQAYDFYMEASKTAYGEKTKEMLITLAGEEKIHLEKVENLLEAVKSLYDEEKMKA